MTAPISTPWDEREKAILSRHQTPQDRLTLRHIASLKEGYIQGWEDREKLKGGKDDQGNV